MAAPGQLAGVYNLVVADEYELFDHRIPLDKFNRMLQHDDVPESVCVIGIENVFDKDDDVDELSRRMDGRADTLESRQPLPTIQFAVEGSFQRRERDFELQFRGELYRLSRVFGPQIERRESGWLTAPF